MKKLLLAALAATMLCGSANAAFTVTYTQGIDGVTATGVGSLITTGLGRFSDFDSGGSLDPFLQPANRTQIVGSDGFQSYLVDLAGAVPQAWGSGGQSNATAGSGGGVYFNNNGGDTIAVLGVPISYRSGSAISNLAFYAGQTFTSLGLNLGSYVYNYGSGTNADSFSLIVSSVPTVVTPPVVVPPTSAVPEPASWAMMVAGFGLAGAAMRRRRATVRFA